MGALARRRRGRCGCSCRRGHLVVFRGLGLVAIMCWESICLIAGKIGRVIGDWAGGDWHDLDDESSSGAETWKCDLCGAIGKGDASSFFGLTEIEHFLESRCRGSLRQHAVALYAQQENRTPAQIAIGLNRASPSIAQSNRQPDAAESRGLMRRRVENGYLLRGGASIAAQELDVMLRDTKS